MKKILTAFSFLFLALTVHAGAGSEYQFIHFDKAVSGLSYDGVKCLLQDSRGYVWAGTYRGLSRYDGTRWVTFDRTDFGTDSDYISSLDEDADGNVWIGTDNGAVVYNFEADSFTFRNSPDAPSDRVFDIECTADGKILLAVRGQGIYSFDRNADSFSSIGLTSGESVYRLEIIPDGRLFYATYCDNLYVADITPGAVFAPSIVCGDMFAADNIEGLDAQGDYIYVASKRHGLVRLGLYDNSFKVMCTLPGDARPVNVTASGGRIWLSTTDGVRLLDPSNGSVSEMRMIPGNSFGLTDNYVTDVMVDSRGGLWVSADEGGVSYSSREMDRFSRILCEGIVKSFAQDDAGRVWVGTERNGLFYFDPERGGSLTKYPSKILPRDVNALCFDGDALWLGSHRGLYRLDTHTGAVRQFSSVLGPDASLDNRVLCIFLSRDRTLYVGTSIGVSRYDAASGNFVQIPALERVTAENMVQDHSGNIWLATYSQGVFVYNPATGSVVSSHNIKNGDSTIPEMTSSVTVDQRGSVWVVGFSAGFFHRVGDSFVHFDRASLPTLPTDVYLTGICDRNGLLWLSSDRGLVQFSPSDSGVKVFTVSDGLLADKFKKGGIALRDGRILMGGEAGFIMFDPSAMTSEDVSRVAITGVTIGGSSPSPDNFTGNVDVTGRIVLAPRERNIAFKFAVPGYSGAASGNIVCRLEGFDSGWRDLSTSRSIEYYNLSKGRYVLQLATTVGGRIIPAHGNVEIVAKPRFLETAFGVVCIILAVLLFASLLFLTIYRQGLSRQRARHRAKEEALKENLYHEKMSFFANVIHEIKTPLTLVRTPLQHLMLSDSLEQNDRDDVSLISDNTDYLEKLVKELLEFISIEENGYVLELRNLDLADRLGFICSNYIETARSANLRLEFSPSEENIVTAVDSRAFSKMVNNLLSNAVKYSETYISVQICREGENVVIRISNDGDRIPADRRENIFVPFVHYGTATQSDNSFGIGLSYARKLARLHGGDLTLSDRDDCTEFVLSLPGRTVEEEAAEESEAPVAAALGQPLLLIVEDNVDLLGYLKRKLSPDYMVIGVNSAEKALDKLRTNKVDLLLTDLGLKSLSGVELCAKVSGDPALAHIPIIVLSAISTLQTKIKCMENGATMYIEKPFSLDYLVSCIKAVLEKKRLIKSAYADSGFSAADKVQADLPDRDDEFVRKLDRLIADNISDSNFTNKQIEESLGISRSSLNRKMKSLLGTTPNDYIRRRRLEVAALTLRGGNVRVSEICYAVGFNSPSYFAKCFKEVYGKLPAEYAKEKNVAESDE